jgi:aspartate racemase
VVPWAEAFTSLFPMVPYSNFATVISKKFGRSPVFCRYLVIKYDYGVKIRSRLSMSKNKMPIIGIIGGVGPYAGLDLNLKIFDQTVANEDQAHLNVVLFSFAQEIPDRTAYLNGEISGDMTGPVVRMLFEMDALGVSVVGIPCNTFHACSIFSRVQEALQANKKTIRLLNMIVETGRFLEKNCPDIARLGALCTNGTIYARVYENEMERVGIKVVYPDKEQQNKLHQAIYNRLYGVKAYSNPVTKKARKDILQVAEHLSNKGVQAILLGCTELPIVIKSEFIKGVPVFDATLILARALIENVAPHKLRALKMMDSQKALEKAGNEQVTRKSGRRQPKLLPPPNRTARTGQVSRSSISD